MKYIALFALFAVVAAKRGYDLDALLDKGWHKYKNAFRKSYKNVDDQNRRLRFGNKLERIVQHNLRRRMGLSHYTVGINKYSDLRDDEISHQLFGFKGANNFTITGITYKPSNNLQSSTHNLQQNLKSSASNSTSTVDWRNEGLVTDVKDQGQCGSCWAFSSTGALEAQMKKKTGNLIPLSEQNLVDCSQSAGNDGCGGGWMNQAFKYIKSNGGIETEDSYPYSAVVGNCTYNATGYGATVTGHVNIPTGDEDSLMDAVATVGPVSAAINAGGDFPDYESGIYDPPVCANTIDDLSHAILIVGYGTESGQDYWLVKNSWGDDWGEEGYFRMARNQNNTCGIATKASYPLV